MRAIGMLILAGVGYYAYTNRATLFGGALAAPMPTPPIGVPPGTTTQIGAPGTVPPVAVIPTTCTQSSQQLLTKAYNWAHGSDRSSAALYGLIKSVPGPCRAQLGTSLKMVGVAVAVVDQAIRAVGAA